MKAKFLLIGFLILVLFTTSSVIMAGAKRNSKTFTVSNGEGDTFQIWIKFGVGYNSKNKVNNVDVTVENKSLSDSFTVKTGKVKVATTYDEIATKDFTELLAADKKMGKTHIIKNDTQSYTYSQIVVDVSVDFGGTTRYFVFWPGSNNRQISMQNKEY